MAVSYVTDVQSLQNVSASTVTFSVAAGTCDAMACTVDMQGTSQSVSSITFNTTENFASIGAANNGTNCRIEAWGRAPTVGGTHNVVVTLSAANAAWDASVISYLGAHQSGGASTFKSFVSSTTIIAGSDMSVTVTSATGDLVQDATVSTTQNGNTVGTDWQDNSGNSNTQGKHYAGATSVVCTESWDADPVSSAVIIGFNVAQAAAVAANAARTRITLQAVNRGASY